MICVNWFLKHWFKTHTHTYTKQNKNWFSNALIVPAAISSNSSSSAGAPTGLANGGKVELSRREREEIEKQRAKERYDKLHAAGKTDQAKADLARLALIREKREQEAAKRREENRVREEDSKKKMQASGRKTTSDSGPSSSKK